MGSFLENLIKQKAAEGETQLISRQNAERAEIASLERAKSEGKQRRIEAEIRERKWQEAKLHFEQSGVRGMLNEIVRIKAALSTTEDRDNKWISYELVGWKWNWHKQHDEPVIKKFEDLNKSKESFDINLIIDKDYSARSEIRITTFSDGTITFHGAEDIAIPQIRWQNNRALLEEKLGVTYNAPKVWPVLHDSGAMGMR
jgi:hypothetical protein